MRVEYFLPLYDCLKWYWLALLPLLGLYALTLVPSQNPVVVGSNVTISLSDPINTALGSWLFGSSTLFIWSATNVFPGGSNQDGISLNITTYQLTLMSVTLKSSGIYVFQTFSPSSAKAEITLDVQGKSNKDPLTLHTVKIRYSQNLYCKKIK